MTCRCAGRSHCLPNRLTIIRAGLIIICAGLIIICAGLIIIFAGLTIISAGLIIICARLIILCRINNYLCRINKADLDWLEMHTKHSREDLVGDRNKWWWWLMFLMIKLVIWSYRWDEVNFFLANNVRGIQQWFSKWRNGAGSVHRHVSWYHN